MNNYVLGMFVVSLVPCLTAVMLMLLDPELKAQHYLLLLSATMQMCALAAFAIEKVC